MLIHQSKATFDVKILLDKITCILDRVQTMPAHFESGENVTVAEFELAFTRCRNNLKTVRDLTVRDSLQDFDAIERYLNPKSVDQSCSKSVENALF